MNCQNEKESETLPVENWPVKISANKERIKRFVGTHNVQGKNTATSKLCFLL